MSDSQQAGPDAETPDSNLEHDPEIEALLDFEPVPRKVKRPDGWTPDLQREFIHRLALCGSPSAAADQMQKKVSGIEAIYKEKGAESFRAAWDAALACGRRRKAEKERGEAFAGRAPGLNVRATHGRYILADPEAAEAEEAMQRLAEAARASIVGKLLGARRLYLKEISGSPGKRAAFEILTELPIDWELAERGEAQPDEPYARPNMRKPDMLLTAENGWLGELTHGADKKAELRKAIDDHRAKEGLGPVDWDAEVESEKGKRHGVNP